MDPGCNQDLFNGLRQIVWQGISLRRAGGQGPPGDEVRSGLWVTLPEIEKGGKRHGLILLHLVFNCRVL
jgi:hypothetical protein